MKTTRERSECLSGYIEYTESAKSNRRPSCVFIPDNNFELPTLRQIEIEVIKSLEEIWTPLKLLPLYNHSARAYAGAIKSLKAKGFVDSRKSSGPGMVGHGMVEYAATVEGMFVASRL